MQTLHVNGYDMAYLEVGEANPGPPLVCVHGSLCDFRIWSVLLGPLAVAAVGWVGRQLFYARFLMRQRKYVEAAQAVGAGRELAIQAAFRQPGEGATPRGQLGGEVRQVLGAGSGGVVGVIVDLTRPERPEEGGQAVLKGRLQHRRPRGGERGRFGACRTPGAAGDGPGRQSVPLRGGDRGWRADFARGAQRGLGDGIRAVSQQQGGAQG